MGQEPRPSVNTPELAEPDTLGVQCGAAGFRALVLDWLLPALIVTWSPPAFRSLEPASCLPYFCSYPALMGADKLTMVQTPERCMSRPGLPDLRNSQQWLPFSDLHTKFDDKRKSLRTLVCVNDDWNTTAAMAPAGIYILDHPSYHEMKSSIFFQCANCDTPTDGHICLAHQYHQGSTRQRRPRFSVVRQSGLIHDCFLAIP